MEQQQQQQQRANINYECDYLIIGRGNAGKAALQKLQNLTSSYSQKPKIIVIDPLMRMNDSSDDVIDNIDHKGKETQLLSGIASGIRPSAHEVYVQVLNDDNNNNNERNNKAQSIIAVGKIHYRNSCLIATGCHGAPPPISLLDDGVMSRVLELRSTFLPLPYYSLPPLSSLTTIDDDKDDTYHEIKTNYELSSHFSSVRKNARPVMTKEGVVQVAEMAIRDGANICILGSSMEALNLAVHLNREHNVVAKSRPNAKGTVTLVCGGSGPLHSRLPRFLITALSKRIHSSTGIIIDEQSLVRYIAMNQERMNSLSQLPPLEVYTVKTYDMLETKRHFSDLLIGES